MTNDSQKKRQLSSSDKIDIICQHIEDGYSTQRSLGYRSAVVAYVTMGIDCFPCEGDKKLEAIWEKTKRILDAEKRQKRLDGKQIEPPKTPNENKQGIKKKEENPSDSNKEKDLSCYVNSDGNDTFEKASDKDTCKRYISDVIDFKEFKQGRINLIYAPCGCGKTTFIETVLCNYANSIGFDFIYLAPTCALKEAFESRNNKNRESSAEDSRTKHLQTIGITAMTYAKFGYIITKMNESPEQDSSRYYGKKTVICLDEMQQGVSQMHYSDASNNITRTALIELVKRAEDESNLVVAITATPRKMTDFLVMHYNCKKTNINVVKSVLNLKGYEPKETCQYNLSLESLINKLDSSQRGLIYIDQIDQINMATSLFEKRGIAAVGIWSLRSKQRLSDKQWSVAKSLIVNEKIPDDVQVLILNAAYQTGLNIDPRKTHLDYIVVHNSNRDVQTQVLGRYRGDIAMAYLKTTEQGVYTIPQDIIEPHLNRKLFKADKDSLCEDINLVDKQGRLRRWPTIKKLLAQQGYQIEEGKSGGRYSLIKLPEE